jgi:integrase/recombinase XerD
MNRRVSVWKYVRIGKKWRYCKPAVGKNGKIRPDWVIVQGKEEHHPEGNFYLHRYEGNKEIWKKIGPNAQDAVNAADFESTYLTARAKGIPVKQLDTPDLSIQAAAHGWLEEVKLSTRPETYELYEHSINEFCEWNSKHGPRRTNLSEVTRVDLLKYRKWLMTDVHNIARTAGNKLSRVAQWYRDVMKVRPGEGPVTVKDTRMGVVEREPEVYTEAELKAFFEACQNHDGLLFQIFLLTGFREDEIKYLTWDDIDGTTATLRVTPKPQYDFEIKDHEERAVVIPYQLLGHLLLYRMIVEAAAENEGRDVYPLIFPTKTGRPNGHMLEKCKRIAKRAGLDPNRFWLHKFRSHYATMLLRSGLDIITVRKMLGHKPGSEATFRYLAPMHHKEVRDKGVDRIFEHILYPWLKDGPRVSGELQIPEGLAKTSDFFSRLAAEAKAGVQEKAKAARAGGERD